MRRRVLAGGVAIGVLVLVVAIAQAPAAPAAPAAPTSTCAAVSLRQGSQLMGAYGRAGAFPTVQTNTPDGVPATVSVEIPPIRFTGAGRSATLPVGPCQHIYRFRFGNVGAPGAKAPSPFRYIEVDWNTEGLPRGPNSSFTSPHFDFHYYLRPRTVVDATTMCGSSNGTTCDPFRTSYAQMRRFLRMPPPQFIPASYAPDIGSSIPMMGLHLLDRAFHYTVHDVDHHPTLIYGTFDGKVLFAEASVTLATLQDAMTAPGHVISFRFRQPRRVQGGVPWPTRYTIRYTPSSGTFRAGFERFRTSPPVIDGCTVQPVAGCRTVGDPIEPSGGGVADSLAAFLRPIFATKIKWTAGQKVSVVMAAHYSFALAHPDGTDGPTIQLPVVLFPHLGVDPTTDLRVQPGALLCLIEAKIVAWQHAQGPLAGGAYVFNLTVDSADGSPTYTATFRHAVPPGTVASPACA